MMRRVFCSTMLYGVGLIAGLRWERGRDASTKAQPKRELDLTERSVQLELLTDDELLQQLLAFERETLRRFGEFNRRLRAKWLV